jgi:trehalose/maltose transport system permease protein
VPAPAQPARAAMRVPFPAPTLARRRARTAWLLLVPVLAVLILVGGWPLARTMSLSLTDAQLGEVEQHTFVGLTNYRDLLVDPDWWRAVWNTLWFAGVSVTLETILGTVMALVLDRQFRGRGLVRAAILIPWAIPTIVSAKMWGWMLHDQFGLLNDALMRLGLIGAPIAWTAAAGTAMWAVIAVDVWKSTPFMALLVLAALQLVPRDCYEAAYIDGVHPVRVFFGITLPLIRPALIVMVVFRTLDALRVFDLIYVLTSNSRATMTMSVYARQQLVDFQDVGYGSAAATCLFAMIAGVTVMVLTFARIRVNKEVGG